MNTHLLDTKEIKKEQLEEFGPTGNLNDQVLALIKQQVSEWELARENYGLLSTVKIREFSFGGFKIITQCNPGRIRSSAAKTDPQSIAQRACFLCPENLPSPQKGLVFNHKYLILVNPFPIFHKHLTISYGQHTPQQIYSYFGDMLDLARELTDFTVFYNGPQCGASAPDHFHFQAVEKGTLPVENEMDCLMDKRLPGIVQKISAKKYLRNVILIQSASKTEVSEAFFTEYHLLSEGNATEPGLNILCSFQHGLWRVFIFPRSKQRPSHFYLAGAKQIVVGPAAVEMGGILVLPRPEDFEKITRTEIIEIYSEVTR